MSEDATKKDENLQMLGRTIFNGWPANKQDVPDLVMPYRNIRDELSTYNGIVFKGERIIMPESLRAEILEILHKSHSRIVRTKQRARDMIYRTNRLRTLPANVPLILKADQSS